MITLAWRGLLTRVPTILAALLSVGLGSALVTATLLVAAAQDREGAASVTSWRFDAVDAVVTPPASVTLRSGLSLDLPSSPRLSQEHVAAIEDAPGVTSVSLERPFPAYLVADGATTVGDALTRSWGHPWSTALADGAALVEGAEPTSAGDVVVDVSVAQSGGVGVGDSVRIQLATGTQRYRVSGVVQREGEQFEHALFFDADTAAGLGGAPVLALVSTTDAAALRNAVPDLTVHTGDARAGSLRLDPRQAELAGGSSRFLLAVAFLALTVAVFVTSSTLAVAVGQRRRELAMLRVVGTAPRLIRRMILGEAVLIGAVGGLLGAGAGVGAAELARDFFVAQGLMARGAEVGAEPTALVAGFGAAVAASVAAALLPARRAARIAPLDALRESDVPAGQPGRGRTAAGVALAGAAAVCLAGVFALGGPVPTGRGSLALMLLMIAFPLLIGAAVLFGPVLLRGGLALVGGLMRRRVGGFLAERSLRSDPRRAAGASVPLTLLVAVCSVMVFQDTANHQARSAVYADQITADLVVSGGPQLGVPVGAGESVARVRGVAAASASVSSRLVIDTPSTGLASATVTGVEPGSFQRVLDHAVTAGSWDRFGRDGIGVSTTVADDKGWGVGDTVDFRFPDGTPGRATVTTVYDDPMGTGDLVLPVDVLTPHLVEPFASAVYVAVAPGSDVGATRERIAAALARTAPSAVVTDRSGHLELVASQASGDNWIVLMAVVILGGYAGVSAVNVLVGSTLARRREFALLRLAGTPRRTIVGSLVVEGAVLATAGAVVGTVIAAATMTGYAYLLTSTVWLPFTGSAFAAVVACAFLAAAIGTLAPARAAWRADPLTAVR